MAASRCANAAARLLSAPLRAAARLAATSGLHWGRTLKLALGAVCRSYCATSGTQPLRLWGSQPARNVAVVHGAVSEQMLATTTTTLSCCFDLTCVRPPAAPEAAAGAPVGCGCVGSWRGAAPVAALVTSLTCLHDHHALPCGDPAGVPVRRPTPRRSSCSSTDALVITLQ